jgi:hypothetical protein
LSLTCWHLPPTALLRATQNLVAFFAGLAASFFAAAGFLVFGFAAFFSAAGFLKIEKNQISKKYTC